MNNYTQKVDKVGTDEVFPYPIRLEYDDEFVYLTVLRIPEPEELKLSPWVMNLLAKGHNISNYMNRLVLCIERDNPRKYNFLDIRAPYRPYPSCGNYQSKEELIETLGPPSRGGDFSIVNSYDIIYNNVEVGRTYEFPLKINRMANVLVCARSSWQNITNIYSKLRGTFRFNTSHPHTRPITGNDGTNLEYITGFCPPPIYERTGIYSNTAKILLYPE